METRTEGRPRNWRRLLQVGIFVAALAVPGVAQAASGQKYAVLNSAGSIVRSFGTTGSIHISTGTYEVDFSSSMLACGYIATPGDSGAGAVSQPAVATVAQRAGNKKGLFIQTFDQSTGSLVDIPFQVQTFCGLKHWAVVAANGTLARGGHATGAIRLAAGQYEVDFDSNVSKCAFTAVLGTTADGTVGDPGQVTVAGRAGNVNGVFVDVVDRSGNHVDSSFHLSVNCGSAKLIAVINANGTKARGANVVSSTKLSPTVNDGRYEVIFNHNTSNCSFTASVGVPTNGGQIDTPVTITTATRAGNNNGVFVFIHQTNGTTIDEPFHLFVLCAPGASLAPASAGDGSQDVASGNAAPVGAARTGGGANG
jgi:hypothetical protein